MGSMYYLEIYEPDDSSCVAGEYISGTPFPSMHIGEAIHGNGLNQSENKRTVRIKDIQHIIWEIDGKLMHKLCVHTELLPSCR